MPEVKELKGLTVAGSATAKDAKKDFFIQLHLTERCNLACRHCYQSGEHGREMEMPAVRDTVVEVSEMLKDWAERYGIAFSPSFNVTGGEPLLREDFFEILGLLRQHEFEISLLTNGTLIDDEKAKRLKDLVNGVQVSIEGPEGVHDSIRGRGAFSGAVAGVERMLAEGIRVSLNVTMSRLNVDCLTDVVTLGRALGVGRVGFSRLVPQGRGKGLREQMIEGARVREVYRTLLRLEDEHIEIGTGDPLAAFVDAVEAPDSGDIPFGGCAAGVSGLTLLPDGTVNPCRRLPIPIGNVGRDSIRRIWTESPVLNQLRDRGEYVGRCGTCSRWAACRGCRAVAYACNGSLGNRAFLGDDPQCFYPHS